MIRSIIVIGTSSGGVDALKVLVAALPGDLHAAIFIVLHRPANSPSLLAEILQSISKLTVKHASNGEAIKPSHIYIAPPDRHLLLEHEFIRLTQGPKENRFRPAIDPLFRSAATTYGPRVIGVVLTGNLDDGTAGLWAIKDQGGITIVQDPSEATYPSMPNSALANVAIDYCLRLKDIATTLATLSAQPITEGMAVSKPIDIETRIASGENALEAGVTTLGKLSPFTCPECQGVLFEIHDGQITRYRCHTGHAYSIGSLLQEVRETIEKNLWSTLRSMDELLLLLAHLSKHAQEQGNSALIEQHALQKQDIQRRVQLVRQALFQTDIPPKEPDNG